MLHWLQHTVHAILPTAPVTGPMTVVVVLPATGPLRTPADISAIVGLLLFWPLLTAAVPAPAAAPSGPGPQNR